MRACVLGAWLIGWVLYVCSHCCALLLQKGAVSVYLQYIYGTYRNGLTTLLALPWQKSHQNLVTSAAASAQQIAELQAQLQAAQQAQQRTNVVEQPGVVDGSDQWQTAEEGVPPVIERR